MAAILLRPQCVHNNITHINRCFNFEGIDDFGAVAQFADEAFLAAQSTVVHVAARILQDLLQHGGQLTSGHIEQVLRE